jgi:hypothetical protein
VDEVPDLPAQGLHQGGRGLEAEAHEVHDRVRLLREHRSCEDAIGLLLGAVGADLLDLVPLCGRLVPGAAGARDVHDLVSGTHQSRYQERTDVAAATDDDDLHGPPPSESSVRML